VVVYIFYVAVNVSLLIHFTGAVIKRVRTDLQNKHRNEIRETLLGEHKDEN